MNKLTPSRVVLLYAIFASAWIAFSGYLLTYTVQDPALEHKLEIAKGFLFVFVTSGILYLLLKVWRGSHVRHVTEESTTVQGTDQRRLYALLFILSLSVPAISYFVIEYYTPKSEQDAFDDQRVISRIKAAQVEKWLEERSIDVQLLSSDRDYAEDLRNLIERKSGADTTDVDEKFESFIRAFHFSQISLLDRNGRILFSRGSQHPIGPELKQNIEFSLQSAKVVQTDLYMDEAADVHIDWVMPVLDIHHEKVIGAVAFRSDPGRFVFPMVSLWPTHYGAAETLLVDHKSGRIIYLDKLSGTSHHQHAKINAEDDPDYQLFMPAMGKDAEGIIKGKDSSGKEVLGGYSAIPSLQWRLLTKVDRVEVLRQLYSTVFWISLLAFFGLVALLSAFFLLWRQRQYLSDLALIAEKNKADRLLQQFYDLPFVGMAVISAHDRSWLRFNDYLCKLLGYEPQELQSIAWCEVFNSEDYARYQQQCDAIFSGAVESCKVEIRLKCKDGSFRNALLDAKCLKDDQGIAEHVIAVFSDISELHTVSERLSQRESHLSALFNTIPDLIWVKDTEGVYLSCNSGFQSLNGASEAQIVGKNDYAFASKELADFFRANDLAAMKADKPTTNEEWLTFVSTGKTALFETIKTPIKDAHGVTIGVLGIARDITERAQAQARVKRLNQLYAWQAQCNKATVRCKTDQDLYMTICKDAIEMGGLTMVWMGMVNRESGMVEPVASSGIGTEYLDNIQINIREDSPFGKGPTGIAIRQNQPVWCQDFMNDPMTLPWRDRAAIFGWKSSASLPLRRNGIAVGCLTLYSNIMEAFDPEVQTLLESVMADISFALKNFDMEEIQRQSDISLRKLSQAVEQSPNTIVITDLDAKIEYVNEAFSQITGYTAEEVIGNNPRVLQSGMTSKAVYDEMWATLTSGNVWKGELVNKRKDGSLYTELAIISPVRQENDKITNYLAIKTDITEYKQNQAKLSLAAKVFEQGNEGIIIADENCNMIMVNRAFTNICGYSEEEVLGKNPKILSSGHQGEEFYRDMWHSISTKGFWQGELWNRKKDGTVYPELLSISRVLDESSQKPQYIGIFTDITQHKVAEENIKWLAHFDVLTGLPNRVLLKDRVNQALSVASRNHQLLALMFLDLDRFKNVNDSLGHHIGDLLLKALAERLQICLREEDTVSRLGGDEFVLLLGDSDVKGASLVAEKVLKVISEPIMIEQYELSITPSIGIAIYPNDGLDYETLLKNADTAMYRTKQNGRNNYCFFTADMQASAEKTLTLDNAMRRAIERNQFMVYYQPQIDLVTGKLNGAEALIRWQHPEMGMISPAEFIPVAEESGQIMQIGEWVLRTAVRQLKLWQDSGVTSFTMAVNLSAVQFRFQDLPDLVGGILLDEQVLPEFLELEVTESVAMDNPESVILMVRRLHELGVKLSIDDFGTGYSSLSYLKRLKVNKLKIDQSFIRHITEDSDDKAIVIGIIGLARNLGMQTIAEGVETEMQRDFLRDHNCDEMQGYLISRPVPAAEFEQFFKKLPG